MKFIYIYDIDFSFEGKFRSKVFNYKLRLKSFFLLKNNVKKFEKPVMKFPFVYLLMTKIFQQIKKTFFFI